MPEQRRLTLSPEVRAFHERTAAALRALEAATSPEETHAARERLRGLAEEGARQIRASQRRMDELPERFR